MMLERGFKIDHTTIYRWVQAYAPEIEKHLRWHWKPQFGYIKVKGKWAYLYRAVDKEGRTIDFYLSSTRNAKAAKRFLGKSLKTTKGYAIPKNINTDQNPAYGAAMRKLKEEGKLPEDVNHQQIKYLNNRLEADHGKLKY